MYRVKYLHQYEIESVLMDNKDEAKIKQLVLYELKMVDVLVYLLKKE